jgi:uncharacterized Fe-S center protein
VAVKLSTGKPPNSNYLRPALIKDLVQSLNGVIVESNTAYGGSRINTLMHRQVAKDHGFTDIAVVDILDEEGSLSLPVQDGSYLKENFVGSHFKGHPMAGLGGAIKNISIGIASAEGKLWIRTGGKSKTSWDGATDWQGPSQTPFLESMAEAGKAVVDSLDGKILYINVMNRLSVDCDCRGNPAEPDMHDIGILSSLDPVALDKACVDLLYAAPDGASLIERMQSRDGIRTINHGAEIGLGSLQYELVMIDG